MEKQPVNTPSAKKVIVTSPYSTKSIFGPQGQRLMPMITQELCGTTGLSAGMVFMPPGRIARPHYHVKTDMIVVVIEGYAASLVGPDLEPVYHGPGEFIFIPEGIVHAAVNLSTTHRLIAIEMRTDPSFNDDVIHTPENDARTGEIADRLHKQYVEGTLSLPEHWNRDDTGPFKFAEVDESDLL
jgi:uncharacterized RmlC-like cupin family protein